jgi:hypothetical protein
MIPYLIFKLFIIFLIFLLSKILWFKKRFKYSG